MSQTTESPKAATQPRPTGTREWRVLSTPPSTLWELLLHPRLLALVTLGASLWWLLSVALAQWTGGEIDVRTYPWSLWVDQFWYTTLFVLVLARLLEKTFQLIGPPPIHMPRYSSSRLYRLVLDPEKPAQWEQFCTQAQTCIGPAEERSPQTYWVEEGTTSVWGSLFLLLGGLVILAGFLAGPHWPALQLSTRLPLLGIPWIAIGLLLQWGKPQMTVVWWKQDNHIQLWAYSEFGWHQLQHKLSQLQAVKLLGTATVQSPETPEDTTQS